MQKKIANQKGILGGSRNERRRNVERKIVHLIPFPGSRGLPKELKVW